MCCAWGWEVEKVAAGRPVCGRLAVQRRRRTAASFPLALQGRLKVRSGSVDMGIGKRLPGATCIGKRQPVRRSVMGFGDEDLYDRFPVEHEHRRAPVDATRNRNHGRRVAWLAALCVVGAGAVAARDSSSSTRVEAVMTVTTATAPTDVSTSSISAPATIDGPRVTSLSATTSAAPRLPTTSASRPVPSTSPPRTAATTTLPPPRVTQPQLVPTTSGSTGSCTVTYGTGGVFRHVLLRFSAVVQSNRPNTAWSYTWTDEFGKVWRNNDNGGVTDNSGFWASTHLNNVDADRWVKAVIRMADGTTCSTVFYSSWNNECSGSSCTPPTTARPNPF
jgi:hypothetical protein